MATPSGFISFGNPLTDPAQQNVQRGIDRMARSLGGTPLLRQLTITKAEYNALPKEVRDKLDRNIQKLVTMDTANRMAGQGSGYERPSMRFNTYKNLRR